MQIRPAEAGDHAAIGRLLRGAFPTDAEARLVDSLRAADADSLELVAEDHDAVIGMVLFSPVEAVGAGKSSAIGLGLAPLAVVETRQGRGIGSALVDSALEFLAALDPPFFAVLGEPDYYARFGFEPASGFDYRWDADVENQAGDAFRLLVRDTNRLPKGPGIIRYHRAFSGF
ncbi:GNAT family N-acetyltransferase [Hyphobacterium marinum]|uniref:N-acetyltransferase n=1 Tax=Hyphobacterium marinum TaxID=3116574 RepID=A0ABU7LUB5_9PROT|nr:N-acetyltransferase [Hyphobacterium sp. Y6023]MEE2565147.1 N-acetyltransferase [Hyphobacterium sp. Y6023]